jgi:hypothetical protein
MSHCVSKVHERFFQINILFLVVSYLLFEEEVFFPQLHYGVKEIVNLSGQFLNRIFCII